MPEESKMQFECLCLCLQTLALVLMAFGHQNQQFLLKLLTLLAIRDYKLKLVQEKIPKKVKFLKPWTLHTAHCTLYTAHAASAHCRWIAIGRTGCERRRKRWRSLSGGSGRSRRSTWTRTRGRRRNTWGRRWTRSGGSGEIFVRSRLSKYIN